MNPAFDPASIKLVVFDLDNTLVAPPERKLETTTLHVLRQMVTMGLPITVATGRSWPSFKPFYDQLPINAPPVLLNGASIFLPEDNTDFYTLGLDPAEAVQVHDMAVASGLHVNCYLDHELLIEKNTPLAQYAQKKENLVARCVGDLRPSLEKSPGKLLLVGDNKDLKAFRENYLHQHGQGTVRMVFSEPDYLEVLHASANKFTALLVLLDALGVEAKDVLAFGDNENDLELVAGVGFGVAVGDCSPLVREAAKTWVEGPDQEGVPHWLQRAFSLEMS